MVFSRGTFSEAGAFSLCLNQTHDLLAELAVVVCDRKVAKPPWGELNRGRHLGPSPTHGHFSERLEFFCSFTEAPSASNSARVPGLRGWGGKPSESHRTELRFLSPLQPNSAACTLSLLGHVLSQQAPGPSCKQTLGRPASQLSPNAQTCPNPTEDPA